MQEVFSKKSFGGFKVQMLFKKMSFVMHRWSKRSELKDICHLYKPNYKLAKSNPLKRNVNNRKQSHLILKTQKLTFSHKVELETMFSLLMPCTFLRSNLFNQNQPHKYIFGTLNLPCKTLACLRTNSPSFLVTTENW